MTRMKPYLKRRSLAPEAKPQESPLKAILQYAAVPLTLITALLYLLGQVHYGAYRSYWGLPESLFPLSKDQSLINGFFRSLYYSTTMLPTMLLVMIGLVVAMLTVIVSTYRPIFERFSRALSKVVPVARKHVIITSAHDTAMDGISLVACVILGLFLLLTVVFPCKWVADQAKESARQEHQEILAGKESGKQFSAWAVLQVKTDATTFAAYSGHLIQISATHVALYDKQRGLLIFPLANVARIEIPERRPGGKR